MLDEKEIKEELFRQLKTEGGLSDDIRETDSLLTWGISSITIMKVLSQWAKRGYKVPFSKLIRNPYLGKWAEIFAASYQGDTVKKKSTKTEDMYQPFDLTDVQYAYWVGRDSSQKLGGVGCHGYFEVDGTGLDEQRVEEAWEVLFAFHPMLRAAYTEDGRQRICKEAFHKQIQWVDGTGASEEEREQMLQQIRKERSHRLLDIAHGEVISLVISKWSGDRFRMHMEIDLLVCDVQSFGIILRDFAAFYLRKELPPVQKEWNFAQYLKEHREKTKAETERARDYWMNRIPDLPDGPVLPGRKKRATLEQLKFHRHAAHISREETEILTEKAAAFGVTPAVVLLTAYGVVLSKWAENKHFLMNMPMFNRKEEEIRDVVADFTNLLLVEMDFRTPLCFSDYLSQVQQSFLDSMDHSAFSGVEILRQIRKQNQGEGEANIVFSCNLGTPLVCRDFQEAFGNIGYMISQTPQVLIDFQAFTATEGMDFIWDAADDMFPEGMVEEIFQCFIGLVRELTGETDWSRVGEPLSSSQKAHREQAEAFSFSVDPGRNLLQDIVSNINNHPERTALIEPEKESITYGELGERVRRVAASLQVLGLQKGEYAGVLMPRGLDCVIAELAVVAAGGAYVPISTEQPAKRRDTILKTAGCRLVLHDGRADLPEDIQSVVYQEAVCSQALYQEVELCSQDSAYVIFTSGSTGTPKGAELTHGAAANTIADVNRRYGVGCDDVAIAVSSNDFDLSVYDIFGLLSAGGSLVLITGEQKREPQIWLSYLKRYGVTVWNSVPTLMKMLLIEAKNEGSTLDSLRLVILSGDWIGLDLPGRMKEWAPHAHLAAMGGATEAAIWSNVFDVEGEIPEEWESIPYGGPLAGQFYRVVGENGMDCPDEVTGELWIGGAGVARGYLGDPALTREKFVEDLGKRWYRTGDNGRFWKNGILEFIGRRDYQIKLRGHRIELGEIESALNGCAGIQQTVALVHGPDENRQLCAFVTGEHLVDKSRAGAFGEETWKEPFSLHYSWEEEAEQEKQIEEISGRASRSLLQKLPDLTKEPVAETWKELYRAWKDLAGKEASKALEGMSEPESGGFSANLEKLLQDFVKPFLEEIPEIVLKGKNPNELVQREDFIAPGHLAASLPAGRFLTKAILDRMEKGRAQAGENFHVLEVGARDLSNSKAFVEAAGEGRYTFADSSLTFLNRAKALFGSESGVDYQVADLDEEGIEGDYDLILLPYTLHTFRNVDRVLEHLIPHVKENGLVLITEMVKEMPLQKLTSVFLMTGGYTDVRKETRTDLLTGTEWRNLLGSHGLALRSITGESWETAGKRSQMVFALYKEKKAITSFDEESLRKDLEKKVPEYMIPARIHCLSAFPLTANGKIDRRRIQEENKDWLAASKEETREEPVTKTEKKLSAIWEKVLGRAAGREEQYFRLGGDSLLATVLTGEIRESFQVPFALEEIFQYPVLRDMAARLDQLLEEAHPVSAAPKRTLFRDPDHAYEPFPLTDVQQAYWIGRESAFNYSEVSTHCYFEMDCDGFDLDLAGQVWNDMIAAHGMLRAVILKDGEHQRILKQVDFYPFRVYALSEEGDICDTLREEMSQEQFDVHTWPLFDIRAVKTGENKSRLFLSFDNIVLDGFSMFYLFKEWAYLVKHPLERPVPETVSFRDYLLSCNALKDTPSYQEDQRYWQEKLPRIHPAPEFGFFARNAQEAKTFKRFRYHLSEKRWQRIEGRLKEHALTPAVFLMGTYAETLGRWCTTPAFSINLTRFNRLDFAEEMEATVGDYTSLTIHSIDLEAGKTMEERLKVMQKNLWEDLNHPLISGVEVERMLNQAYGTGSMPVVFTCGLGLTREKDSGYASYPGKIIYGNSQTPQVWLDYQVYEEEGGLEISWDALIDIFPDHMVAEMFEAYTGLLEQLADIPDSWVRPEASLIEAGQDPARLAANETKKELSTETLTSLLLGAFGKYPDQLAVIDDRRNLTYRQLQEEASHLALSLWQEGFQPGQIAAVCLKKGWEQVVAVSGILLAGGIYLPLNAAAPKKRNQKILALSGAVIRIDEETFMRLQNRDNPMAQWQPPVTRPEDLAYIIYTSGTTGEPKGVAIEHRGAVNTILDINDRLQITGEDRAIAISDLSFDLSVYDLFGMLSAGGALVFPARGRETEPEEWKRLVETRQVSVWNTVPMFMQMFTRYLMVHPLEKETVLRQVLMSGDWIPLTLYPEIQNLFPGVRVYGLGGATEASIWSNIYEIREVKPDWRSIPYGKPLANQRYYVLNRQMMDCPCEIMGDLYIAGEGLAREYWKNPEETGRAFLWHEGKKQRLYKTGDRALYQRDGNIEFCGRQDGQVKIAGFRIELGEINHAICAEADVLQAESIVEQGEIYSFLVCRDGKTVDPDQIRTRLQGELPHYMIPSRIQILEEIPCTQNGKVDRKKLASMAEKPRTKEKTDQDRSSWTGIQQELAEIWEEILGTQNFGREDDFVQLGGNSLAAVQLVNRITQKYRMDLMIGDFYQDATISGLAQRIEQAQEEEEAGEL